MLREKYIEQIILTDLVPALMLRYGEVSWLTSFAGIFVLSLIDFSLIMITIMMMMTFDSVFTCSIYYES